MDLLLVTCAMSVPLANMDCSVTSYVQKTVSKERAIWPMAVVSLAARINISLGFFATYACLETTEWTAINYVLLTA
mgnify:CR=1 FL=1